MLCGKLGRPQTWTDSNERVDRERCAVARVCEPVSALSKIAGVCGAPSLWNGYGLNDICCLGQWEGLRV